MAWSVEVELVIPRPLFRWAAAGALMLAVVPDLGSESVTLATHYPAPAGAYASVITSSSTYLAYPTDRSFRVKVGDNGSPPAVPVFPLDVVGNIKTEAAESVNYAPRLMAGCGLPVQAPAACVGKYVTFTAGVYSNEQSGPDRFDPAREPLPQLAPYYYCCDYPAGGSQF